VAHNLTKPSPKSVDGLVTVMDDAIRNHHKPLTHARLFTWHSELFAEGSRRIKIGQYRDHAEAMQIVSGRIGREKVHYEAPPSAQVNREMTRFLKWFKESAPNGRAPVNGLVRAAVAHFWFETIHPFEDGNGRLGRAICDLALAQDCGSDVRLYCLSKQILKQRSEYYERLAEAQLGSGDLSEWAAWFVTVFENACYLSAGIIKKVLYKSHYWREAPAVNERQRKVLERLLEALPEGFLGGMSAEKYGNLTGASKATATRDLSELLSLGLLAQSGQGRGTRYHLVEKKLFL
jgi:Fic family protein